MRVEGVGIGWYPLLHTPTSTVANVQSGSPIISKEEMEKLFDIMIYNQSGMAFKLARIAGELYAGQKIDLEV